MFKTNGAIFTHRCIIRNPDLRTCIQKLLGGVCALCIQGSVAAYAQEPVVYLKADELFAELAYTHLDTGRFEERGGAATVSGFKDSTDATTTTLGPRASRQFSEGNGSLLTASGMISWRYTFGYAHLRLLSLLPAVAPSSTNARLWPRIRLPWKLVRGRPFRQRSAGVALQQADEQRL
jgi:hypothetical protein